MTRYIPKVQTPLDMISEQTFMNVISLVIGTFIGISLKWYLDNKTSVAKSHFELKETRYKAIIILMWSFVNTRELKKLKKYRSDIKSFTELKYELCLELYNCLLFASDNVIRSFMEFINEPSYQLYSKTLLSMRKDLYGKKTKLKALDLVDINQK